VPEVYQPAPNCDQEGCTQRGLWAVMSRLGPLRGDYCLAHAKERCAALQAYEDVYYVSTDTIEDWAIRVVDYPD